MAIAFPEFYFQSFNVCYFKVMRSETTSAVRQTVNAWYNTTLPLARMVNLSVYGRPLVENRNVRAREGFAQRRSHR